MREVTFKSPSCHTLGLKYASYLGVIVDAVCWLSPQDVILQFFAVGGLVGCAVVDLGRHDGDLVGKAGAHLVGHDENQVGVRNQLNNEWPAEKCLKMFLFSTDSYSCPNYEPCFLT